MLNLTFYHSYCKYTQSLTDCHFRQTAITTAKRFHTRFCALLPNYRGEYPPSTITRSLLRFVKQFFSPAHFVELSHPTPERAHCILLYARCKSLAFILFSFPSKRFFLPTRSSGEEGRGEGGGGKMQIQNDANSIFNWY